MNDESTFLFNEKIQLKRRQDSLEDTIDFYKSRIDTLIQKASRPWRQQRIERYETNLAVAQEELEFVTDELTFFSDITNLPKDTFNIALNTFDLPNGRAFTTAAVAITDSLFDNTFVSGDEITVWATASKPRRSASTKFQTVPVEITEGEGTFIFGSTKLGNFATKYDNLVISFRDDNGDTIYSQEWDVTNIV